jgi:hypothetical protein
MRRAVAVLGLVVLVSGAVSLNLIPEDIRAEASDSVFLVPANSGYGVGECLAAGATCGQIVADSWCQSQGFSRAASYTMSNADGAADPVRTASIRATEQPVAITCTR